MEYIAFDAHKHYTPASVARSDGRLVREQRLAHERGAFQQFLARCEPGSPVALETVGNWYWIVDEIEGAGCLPKLVHARKAKLMMGQINKTDKLDARGLNTLQRNGTLPTVWIPPGAVRDQRELPRTRMALVRQPPSSRIGSMPPWPSTPSTRWRCQTSSACVGARCCGNAASYSHPTPPMPRGNSSSRSRVSAAG
jgi:hypothetical protein